MTLSVFDLFRIGIGPSSSHTVGPMRAAGSFVSCLDEMGLLPRVQRVQALLFGSLGATGEGHGSDRAVVLGLLGEQPEEVEPESIEKMLSTVSATGLLDLGGVQTISFNQYDDIQFRSGEQLPFHPNGMRLTAFDDQGEKLDQQEFYSVGGGFVVHQGETDILSAEQMGSLPLPFSSGDQLLELCRQNGLTISELLLRNESHFRQEDETRRGLLERWAVMQQCVESGCHREGELPGGLGVRRRAPALFNQLVELSSRGSNDPLQVLDWVNLYAIAVNEENASGGRVVTAPTNGAAGIIPAVLHYYDRFVEGACEEGVVRFLLTAGAIGMLYKMNASISGAEVGCQGEVGSACSMAAAALAEVMGGRIEQVENAAEIAMEHQLGLTCDPIGGLVQIPCIERNAIAANQAINAARMALQGDGRHFVSLDAVIRTMHETGTDMESKYKETAEGGLAVNVIEC